VWYIAGINADAIIRQRIAGRSVRTIARAHDRVRGQRGD
jgi:hypothetical protein